MANIRIKPKCIKGTSLVRRRDSFWYPALQVVVTGAVSGGAIGGLSGFVTGSFGNAAVFTISAIGTVLGTLLGIAVGLLSALCAIAAVLVYCRLNGSSRRALVGVAALVAATAAVLALLAVFAHPHSQVSPWWFVVHGVIAFAVALAVGTLLTRGFEPRLCSSQV